MENRGDKDDVNPYEKEKQSSLEVMVLYRSLYILKRKFEIYKEQIYQIYKKYEILYQNKKTSTKYQIKINVDNFEKILKEIFDLISTFIIPMDNPKDVFISNLLITNEQKLQMAKVIHQLYLFIKEKIEKYNKIFYEKKIKIKTDKGIQTPIEEIEDMTIPIVEYDKKGNIVKSFNQLLNDNITFPLIPTINEETNNINTNNKIIDKEISVNIDLNNSFTISKSLLENNSSFLFIETLPLIIADFLQEYPFYILAEVGDDLLGELSTLFDKDILSKIEEDTKNKKEKELKEAMQIPLKRELIDCIKQRHNVKQNIKLYEKLLLEKKGKGENTIFIEDMLEKLLAQKIWLEHKINNIKEREAIIPSSEMIQVNKISSQSPNISISVNKNNQLSNSKRSPLSSGKKKRLNFSANKDITLTTNGNNKTIAEPTREEKREKAFHEIFSFYSRQHNLVGQTPLFETIQEKKEHLDMAEFSKFCSEFNVPITRQKLVEIFKKVTSNLRTMTYDEFHKALEKMSIAVNDLKKFYITKKISQTKEEVHLMEIKESQRQEEEKLHNLFTEKNTGGKAKGSLEKSQFYYLSKHKKLMDEISSKKYELDKLEKKTYHEILEEFYSFLEIDNESNYKKKMKGFNTIPFKTYDKSYRIPKKTFDFKVKDMTEVQDIINYQKREKKKLLLAQELLKKELLYQHKQKLFDKNNKKLTQHYTQRLKEKNYSDALNKIKEQLLEKEKKIALIRKKQEEERRNKISWDRLGEIDLDDLDMNEDDKEFFLESYNSDDEELMNHLGLAKKKKNQDDLQDDGIKTKLVKNNSAMLIQNKQKNEQLPKLKKENSNTNLNISSINQSLTSNNQSRMEKVNRNKSELNRQNSLIKAGESVLKPIDTGKPVINSVYPNKNMESQTGMSLLLNNHII